MEVPLQLAQIMMGQSTGLINFLLAYNHRHVLDSHGGGALLLRLVLLLLDGGKY